MPVYDNIQTIADLIEKYNLGAPDVAPEQPAVTLDDQGNRNVYLGSRRIMSISNDGTITHYINGMPVMAERLLESGELYHFRTYRQHGELLEMLNEHGETIGWEILGLNDRTLRRFDAYGRPIFNLVDVDGVYWQHDLVNNIWKKLEHGMTVEERLGSISGPIIAYWQRGEHFGKEGLWKVEKDWDKNEQKVTDMFYTLYNSTATEDYEKYYRDGFLVEKKTWEKGKGLVLYEVWYDRLDYTKFGNFGWKEEGDIAGDAYVTRWVSEYEGSKLVKARMDYTDYYDERIYDITGDLDKTVRRDKVTNEILLILEDRVYFSEVEDMNAEELADFFELSSQGGKRLFDLIEPMKADGKGSASLFGIWKEPRYKNLFTLYNENNQPLMVVDLLRYTDLANRGTLLPLPSSPSKPIIEPISEEPILDESIPEPVLEEPFEEPLLDEPLAEEPIIEPVPEESEPESILDHLSKFLSRFLPK